MSNILCLKFSCGQLMFRMMMYLNEKFLENAKGTAVESQCIIYDERSRQLVGTLLIFTFPRHICVGFWLGSAWLVDNAFTV